MIGQGFLAFEYTSSNILAEGQQLFEKGNTQLFYQVMNGWMRPFKVIESNYDKLLPVISETEPDLVPLIGHLMGSYICTLMLTHFTKRSYFSIHLGFNYIHYIQYIDVRVYMKK